MKSIQQAVTAPVALEASDGTTYTFAPISPKVLSEFCRHVNSTEGRKPDHMVPFEEMMGAAQTLDGMLWLLWRCAKEHHPHLKRESVHELIPSIKTMQQVVTALMDMGEDQEDDARPPHLVASTGASSAA